MAKAVEYFALTFPLKLPSETMAILVKWLKSKPGWAKINSDGSASWHGRTKISYQRSKWQLDQRNLWSHPTNLECCGRAVSRDGINLALAVIQKSKCRCYCSNKSYCEYYMHSNPLQQTLDNDCKTPTPIPGLLSHAFREANQCTDGLVRISVSDSLSFIFYFGCLYYLY